MRENLPVLVVGAGPVGLTAAAELSRRGVPVRLIDRAAGPSRLTKALMVWPRTLDILRQLGGTEHIVDHGLPVDAFRYYSDARVICNIQFDPLTQPVVLPQPDVEDLLRAKLAELGGATAWQTRLIAVEQDDEGVTATLRDADGAESAERFSYLIGCDGAGSTVRELLGLEFHGATYPNLFILADIRVDGDLQFDAVHYYISGNGILVMVPMPGRRFRIFTAGPPTLRPEDLDVPLLQRYVDERGPGGLRLHDVGWHTTFSIHARHTDQFHRGRVFLAGDAAHIHSPAGGQGLNTGVADAHNLAWKLALVARGEARPELLDSFAAERGQVARAVIRQAQVQTRIWMLRGYRAGARDLALRVASGLRLFHRAYVPWLAGLRTTYGTALGAGKARHGFRSGALVGDQAVWDARRNRRLPLRAALDDLRYTLLVVSTGSPDATTRALLERVNRDFGATVDLRVLDPRAGVLSDAGGEGAGRTTDLLLVRPDGYLDAVVPAAGGAAVLARLRSVLRAASPVPARSSMADM